MFSGSTGESTGVVIFEDGVRSVGPRLSSTARPRRRAFSRPPMRRTPSYCIGARAGFGDLLIGAGALMIEANGLDADRHGLISASRWWETHSSS